MRETETRKTKRAARREAKKLARTKANTTTETKEEVCKRQGTGRFSAKGVMLVLVGGVAALSVALALRSLVRTRARKTVSKVAAPLAPSGAILEGRLISSAVDGEVVQWHATVSANNFPHVTPTEGAPVQWLSLSPATEYNVLCEAPRDGEKLTLLLNAAGTLTKHAFLSGTPLVIDVPSNVASASARISAVEAPSVAENGSWFLSVRRARVSSS